MSKSALAVVLALSVAAGWESALAQESTEVAPLTILGQREPPVEMLPDINTCKAATDPYVAALRATGTGGPRIYAQTRLPRSPDYNAPPLSPPGSPVPEVMSLRDYHLYAKRMRRSGARQYRDIARCLDSIYESSTSGLNGLSDDSTASSLEASPPDGGGRAAIQLRDKSLPQAFALFDDGRYEEALTYFEEADRKLGAPEAMLHIGKIHLFGLKDRSDPVEGVRWLKRTAGLRFNAWQNTPVFDPSEPERNTPMGEAAMILADIYSRGHGPIAKDPAEARQYLQRAYDVGHIRAAKILGDIYYNGIDTPRDLKKAFKAYSDAAKFAYGPAMIALAQMYETGEAEGGADPKKALAWRAEAARRDDPAALYALAVTYDHGEGVAADPDRALSLYKLAAMNGEPAAMTALGTYFYRGEGGLERDHAMARRWFEAGALGGDPDGMFNLAAMMARGEGGAADRVKAWGWLKIAERMGHPQAAAATTALEAKFTDADRAGVAALKAGAAAASPED